MLSVCMSVCVYVTSLYTTLKTVFENVIRAFVANCWLQYCTALKYKPRVYFTAEQQILGLFVYLVGLMRKDYKNVKFFK